MTNGFDIKRMFEFLKYLLFSGKKNIFVQPLMIFIGVMFVNLIIDVAIYSKPEAAQFMAFMKVKPVIVAMLLAFVTIYVSVFPSRVQQFLAKKGEHPRFMMLPIADSERFVAVSIVNFLIVPVLFYAALALGIFVVTLPEMVIFPSFTSDMFSEYFSALGDVARQDTVKILAIYMMISTFSLGAYFWHKHPAAKTLGMWFCAYVGIIFVGMLIDRFGTISVNATHEEASRILSIGFSIIIAVSYAASWFAFKKRSAISRAY